MFDWVVNASAMVNDSTNGRWTNSSETKPTMITGADFLQPWFWGEFFTASNSAKPWSWVDMICRKAVNLAVEVGVGQAILVDTTRATSQVDAPCSTESSCSCWAANAYVFAGCGRWWFDETHAVFRFWLMNPYSCTHGMPVWDGESQNSWPL